MEEKILLALAPIIFIVANTMASTTDSSTAYSAMSCPSSRASLSNGQSHKFILPDLGASGEGCLAKPVQTVRNRTGYLRLVRKDDRSVPKTEQVWEGSPKHPPYYLFSFLVPVP